MPKEPRKIRSKEVETLPPLTPMDRQALAERSRRLKEEAARIDLQIMPTDFSADTRALAPTDPRLDPSQIGYAAMCLDFILDGATADETIGDLVELYRRRRNAGLRYADAWLWAQVGRAAFNQGIAAVRAIAGATLGGIAGK
jgi:hypothetical protein